MQADNADDFLIEQVRSGEEAAWRQLIDRYHGRLLAFARARLPGLADADDVVQEALIGFLQSLPNYDARRSLETYLFTILRYKLIDRLRSRKGQGMIPLDGGEDDSWDQLTPEYQETPSQAAAALEFAERQEECLASALHRLIREYRDRGAFDDLQAIELLFYAGRRNRDVGDLLEVDQKAVAGVKFRAINKLRAFLSEAEDADLGWDDEAAASVTVARTWRNHRLTCLKRSTLGSYLLGVLEEPWLSYTRFHLEVVNCSLCLANLADLEDEQLATTDGESSETLFASSVGFLSRRAPERG